MASGPITSQQIDGETMETVRDFIFGGCKITALLHPGSHDSSGGGFLPSLLAILSASLNRRGLLEPDGVPCSALKGETVPAHCSHPTPRFLCVYALNTSSWAPHSYAGQTESLLRSSTVLYIYVNNGMQTHQPCASSQHTLASSTVPAHMHSSTSVQSCQYCLHTCMLPCLQACALMYLCTHTHAALHRCSTHLPS